VSPREVRCLELLLDGRWHRREALDRITGSSNGPDVVYKLRRDRGGCGFIESRGVETHDRDGRVVQVGVYRLKNDGMAWAQELLRRWRSAA
jgi:hypothetical protein